MDEQADRMQGYRYIAPRRVDPHTQIPSPESVEEGRSKRASMACLECKKRRTKCSTGNPCTECAARERPCVYDKNADKRRKEHVLSAKHQLHVTEESLLYYHGFLEDLLESLRLGRRDQLDQLIEVIQSTEKNTYMDEPGIYEDIRTAVDAILSECTDAEGDVVEMEPETTAP